MADKINLKITIGKITFKNPIWVASGTFAAGREFEDFFDINEVGAIVTKTVTLEARIGNPVPRICETPSGLLNSIGLENKGLADFLENEMPRLKKLDTRVIVSVAGTTPREFEECVARLSGKDSPDAIELNLSCPNVSHKGAKGGLFSQDARFTKKIISAVRERTDVLLIAKLSPNVTDIGAIARAAEESGADAVAVVNTYQALAVDAENMKPFLGNIVGGLSGPAIKPMALKAVKDVYAAVKIPVIGTGGIMTGIDAAEFMLTGAAAVQVGTASLADPVSYPRILEEFNGYLGRKKISKASDLTGKLWKQLGVQSSGDN